MDGNNIEGTLDKYKDQEYSYAATSGAFQAMASMDNDTFKRAISTIENIEKDLEL